MSHDMSLYAPLPSSLKHYGRARFPSFPAWRQSVHVGLVSDPHHSEDMHIKKGALPQKGDTIHRMEMERERRQHSEA